MSTNSGRGMGKGGDLVVYLTLKGAILPMQFYGIVSVKRMKERARIVVCVCFLKKKKKKRRKENCFHKHLSYPR